MISIFLATFAWASYAIEEQALVSCSASLHQLSEWTVPFSGNVKNAGHSFDEKRKLIFLEGNAPSRVFVISNQGTFVLNLPPMEPNANLVQTRRFQIEALPIGGEPAAFETTYALGRRLIRPLYAESLKLSTRISLRAEPASEEERIDATEKFREQFGKIWHVRHEVKDPSFLAHSVNLLNGKGALPREVVEEAEKNCVEPFRHSGDCAEDCGPRVAAKADRLKREIRNVNDEESFESEEVEAK